MKLSAFILLLSFAGYFAETIKIPLSFAVNCKKNMYCAEMMKERCMKKHHGDKPGKCSSPDGSSSCANCPFNSVTIFEQYKFAFNSNTNYKQEYPSKETPPLPDYTSATWKPPNIILV